MGDCGGMMADEIRLCSFSRRRVWWCGLVMAVALHATRRCQKSELNINPFWKLESLSFALRSAGGLTRWAAIDGVRQVRETGYPPAGCGRIYS